jgi:hypothetical protein
VKRPTVCFILFLASGGLGGCFGRQEILLDKKKVVYIHGGLLSFGVLVIRDLELETQPNTAEVDLCESSP